MVMESTITTLARGISANGKTGKLKAKACFFNPMPLSIRAILFRGRNTGRAF